MMLCTAPCPKCRADVDFERFTEETKCPACGEAIFGVHECFPDGGCADYLQTQAQREKEWSGE